ncbi:4-carboxymethylen-4-sulfo-but-2-en-olide hydrolase [Hyphodiscus hymeniophilus]|uniref:4-carboxymethylen-4-sulfo-but-2-en-olide hydrolase n=1 Tax=Hyphodiscus hymeniophilus TaxID=353542 RepID=A0A9P7B1D7_9HELO|nr:4-carboxymethylen-4-sulfo-but-2-en-olide hydrolase [Hyphodiscus hymeniophilus]
MPLRRDLLKLIPPDSWDSHMHILDPAKGKLSVKSQYTPKRHLLPEALEFESSVGLQNIVLVQPSCYGNDNTCILDGLRQIGPKNARAVVTFDPNTTAVSTLREWHTIGVRGVRVNLKSVGKEMELNELMGLLRQYADMIRSLDWVLQLYVPIATVAALENVIPELRVKVCFDHFGMPELPSQGENSTCFTAGDPYLIPGVSSLIKLLSQGNTFVKMSAPYRISTEAGHQDLEPVAKELLRVAGRTRVVFATDWPHTRFEGLDIEPFMEQVVGWCGNDGVLLERVFRSNAKELWSIEEEVKEK